MSGIPLQNDSWDGKRKQRREAAAVAAAAQLAAAPGRLPVAARGEPRRNAARAAKGEAHSSFSTNFLTLQEFSRRAEY